MAPRPSPWLWPYALLCGGSVVAGVALALAHSVGALTWPPSPGLDLSGWRALFVHGEFWRSLAYSATLSAVTLALALALALALLAMLGEALRHGWLARLVLLPLAMPPVVAALLAVLVLGDSGVLSRCAWHLGVVTTPADFPTLVFDPLGRGIIITHVMLVTPLLLLLFDNLAMHLQLPALMQQARALGASRVQALRRLAWPLLLRQARPVLLVYGLALLGAYEIPLMVGAAQPTMISVTIQRAVAGYDLAQRPVGYAMASTYLLLLVALWLALAPRATAERAARR